MAGLARSNPDAIDEIIFDNQDSGTFGERGSP